MIPIQLVAGATVAEGHKLLLRDTHRDDCLKTHSEVVKER